MSKLKNHTNKTQPKEPERCPRCNKEWDSEEREIKICSGEDCTYPFEVREEFEIEDYIPEDE